jgi:diguanylate cyclase (GGDEF)-like protein
VARLASGKRHKKKNPGRTLSQIPTDRKAAGLVRLRDASHAAPTSEQDSRTTNKAFNLFLNIGQRDKTLLARYRKLLGAGAENFARIFYDYLFLHPATAQVLHTYEQQGGKLEWLIDKQTRHLHELLLANTDDSNAARMAHIGEAHYRHQIAPVWIMGAYLRYLDHLLGVADNSRRVRASDRAGLEDAITKLVFRDMGLMLEGYWLAANQALAAEHDKVTALQQQVTSLLANIPQLIWSVDVVNNRPIYISPVTRAICNKDVEMPIPCLGWTVAEDRERVHLAWARALAGEKVEVETRVQEPGGPLRWFRRVFYPLSDDTGRVVRIDGLMEDITETRVMTDRLQTLATTDSLTGLPNRTLFQDRLAQAIAAAARRPGRHVVLMLMDLDHFKEINDTLGHPAGDQILIKVAQRLTGVLREGDTLTRLGGDEYAVLLPQVDEPRRTAERVAVKILESLASPFHYGDSELFLGASIGIAVFPEHGEDLNTLMSHADVAMYSCKNRDARYTFYDRSLDTNVPQRLQLSAELRHALERHEFELYYQPLVDIKQRQLIGTEALLRWRHPTRGMVGPDEFIPLAERSGLIKPITDWVIETATAQCLAWRAQGRFLRMAVNVSGRVFQDPKFAERVDRIVSSCGIRPGCLELEITESVLMSDVEHVARTLHTLSSLGISIAIDDFGTGYSSLTYLKQLALHRLKIDKSFVLDMSRDDNDAIIARTIIDLAHNFGREVVAEGIEDAETWGLLERLGCDSAQGHYIGRPMPAAQFDEWLKSAPWSVGTDA